MQNTSRRLEMMAAFVCSSFLGFILWNCSLSSDTLVAPTDYFVLVLYIVLTLCSYLLSLGLLSRYYNSSQPRIVPHWVYASFLGTLLPFLVNCVHIWYRNHPELSGFVVGSALLLLLFTLVMTLLMALIIGMGRVLITLMNGKAKRPRSVKIPGIEGDR